jgi:IPT/TIG domain
LITAITNNSGHGFADKPQLACRFYPGAPLAPATYVSPVELRCTAPAHLHSTALPAPFTSTVTVTNNGADFADTGAVYTYRPAALPVELVPSSGPLRGGTVVTVRGTGFAASSTPATSSSSSADAAGDSSNSTAAVASNSTLDSVMCHFSFAAGGAAMPRAAVVVVPALSVTATAVRCVTPVSPLLRAGSVVLEVADSGGLTTAGLLFNYR